MSMEQPISLVANKIRLEDTTMTPSNKHKDIVGEAIAAFMGTFEADVNAVPDATMDGFDFLADGYVPSHEDALPEDHSIWAGWMPPAGPIRKDMAVWVSDLPIEDRLALLRWAAEQETLLLKDRSNTLQQRLSDMGSTQHRGYIVDITKENWEATDSESTEEDVPLTSEELKAASERFFEMPDEIQIYLFDKAHERGVTDAKDVYALVHGMDDTVIGELHRVVMGNEDLVIDPLIEDNPIDEVALEAEGFDGRDYQLLDSYSDGTYFGAQGVARNSDEGDPASLFESKIGFLDEQLQWYRDIKAMVFATWTTDAEGKTGWGSDIDAESALHTRLARRVDPNFSFEEDVDNTTIHERVKAPTTLVLNETVLTATWLPFEHSLMGENNSNEPILDNEELHKVAQSMGLKFDRHPKTRTPFPMADCNSPSTICGVEHNSYALLSSGPVSYYEGVSLKCIHYWTKVYPETTGKNKGIVASAKRGMYEQHPYSAGDLGADRSLIKEFFVSQYIATGDPKYVDPRWFETLVTMHMSTSSEEHVYGDGSDEDGRGHPRARSDIERAQEAGKINEDSWDSYLKQFRTTEKATNPDRLRWDFDLSEADMYDPHINHRTHELRWGRPGRFRDASLPELEAAAEEAHNAAMAAVHRQKSYGAIGDYRTSVNHSRPLESVREIKAAIKAMPDTYWNGNPIEAIAQVWHVLTSKPADYVFYNKAKALLGSDIVLTPTKSRKGASFGDVGTGELVTIGYNAQGSLVGYHRIDTESKHVPLEGVNEQVLMDLVGPMVVKMAQYYETLKAAAEALESAMKVNPELSLSEPTELRTGPTPNTREVIRTQGHVASKEEVEEEKLKGEAFRNIVKNAPEGEKRSWAKFAVRTLWPRTALSTSIGDIEEDDRLVLESTEPIYLEGDMFSNHTVDVIVVGTHLGGNRKVGSLARQAGNAVWDVWKNVKQHLDNGHATQDPKGRVSGRGPVLAEHAFEQRYEWRDTLGSKVSYWGKKPYRMFVIPTRSNPEDAIDPKWIGLGLKDLVDQVRAINGDEYDDDEGIARINTKNPMLSPNRVHSIAIPALGYGWRNGRSFLQRDPEAATFKKRFLPIVAQLLPGVQVYFYEPQGQEDYIETLEYQYELSNARFERGVNLVPRVKPYIGTFDPEYKNWLYRVVQVHDQDGDLLEEYRHVLSEEGIQDTIVYRYSKKHVTFETVTEKRYGQDAGVVIRKLDVQAAEVMYRNNDKRKPFASNPQRIGTAEKLAGWQWPAHIKQSTHMGGNKYETKTIVDPAPYYMGEWFEEGTQVPSRAMLRDRILVEADPTWVTVTHEEPAVKVTEVIHVTEIGGLDETEYVRIHRPTKWAFPHKVSNGSSGETEQTLIQWANWFGEKMKSGEITKRDLARLHGKKLACYCPAGKPCIGLYLAEMADRAYAEINS